MSLKDRPIGFFDSGVGGISVLKESIKLMPNEHFIYLGDSANAPYGIKNVEELKQLSKNAAEFLYEKNVKAIVVACNTATSVAINYLRDEYKDIPVIGIEPALKPAVSLNREGIIIIMATPITLSEKKFNNLMNKFNNKSKIEPMPCPGLVELIEDGIVEGPQIEEYLKEKFKKYGKKKISAVVLGCTHYPFVSKTIKDLLGEEVVVLDGGLGTSKQLMRKLEENNLLKTQGEGKVEIYNSLDDTIVKLSYELLYK